MSEKLDVLWTYYETFLGHIQLLNISPIKELSAIFTNLKVSGCGWSFISGGRASHTFISKRVHHQLNKYSQAKFLPHLVQRKLKQNSSSRQVKLHVAQSLLRACAAFNLLTRVEIIHQWSLIPVAYFQLYNTVRCLCWSC